MISCAQNLHQESALSTNDDFRIQTLTLARATNGVIDLCNLAKAHGINLPADDEILHAHTPIRQDFPAKDGAERISARVIVFKQGRPSEWSMRFTLRCGNHRTRDFHREAFLQCDYRYPNMRRVTIHIKDESGLLQRKLGIDEEPFVNQRYGEDVHKAVWLKNMKRFVAVMNAMLELYAKQPIEFINNESRQTGKKIASA